MRDVEADRVVLPISLLEVGGLCSLKVRLLFCRLAQGPTLKALLEVGVLHGATSCCALTGDVERVAGVDNFSQFNGDVRQTEANWRRFRKPGAITELCVADLFTASPSGQHDWYYYDADHGYEATRDAMGYYLPCLEESFLLLVDDYDWLDVQRGVKDGLEAAGLKVEWSRHLPSAGENHFESWWNGMFVAVVSRA